MRHRKLLKGDLLRDRDFTLPELDGVAGVELVPGAVRGSRGAGGVWGTVQRYNAGAWGM